MKKILFSVVFIITANLSFAQEKLTYSKDYNGNTVAKDQYGNIVATGSTNYNGDFVWKDKYGNVIKTESKDYNGNNVSKDKYGIASGRISSSSFTVTVSKKSSPSSNSPP